MGWGALNIYLYSSVVVCFSINSTSNYLDNLNMEAVEKSIILDYLEDNSISLDDDPLIPLLNELNDDDVNFISVNGITLGFWNDKLFYISQGKFG